MKNLIPMLIWLFLVVPSQAGIIYVDANATGDMNGVNWANAYNYLQDALADANSNADVNEIWVAEGIYTPDSNSADPNGSGDRTAMFQLINGVALKGGYAGFGEPDPNARDIGLYETILSGDLDDNDDGFTNNDENSHHVVSGSETDANAVLDGFTITAGNADGSWPQHDRGGGMYNSKGSPTVTNCTFSENSAGLHGGGMYNPDNSNPTLTNCTFSGNSANDGGGMRNYNNSSPTLTNCTFSGNSANDGGGIFNGSSSPTLTNCTFTDNSASSNGGGMYNEWYSSPTLTNCTFSGNSANDGGGMWNYNNSSPMLTNCTFSGNSALFGGGMCNSFKSNPTITNCTFTGNSADWGNGGGMYNYEGSDPTLTNCIFSGNSAKVDGGGIFNGSSSPTLTNCTFTDNSASSNGGGMYNEWYSSPTVTNCILWGNTAEMDGGQIALYSADYRSMATISYSDVQGGLAGVYIDPNCFVVWGLGNIDADPCFVEPGQWVDANDPNVIVEPNDPNAIWVDGDYHLKSFGWRWDTQRKIWTWDDVTSRCIDAGNPGSSVGEELLSVPDDPNNEWGQNLRINMGAFGGTAEASMPPYDWALLADLTNDGTVNFEDYVAQAIDWMESESEQPGDLNRDGTVDIADLALLTEDWLEQTSWYVP